MSSTFLKDLVSDMRAHGETSAVIECEGQPVEITLVKPPAAPVRPLLTDQGAAAFWNLLAICAAQNSSNN